MRRQFADTVHAKCCQAESAEFDAPIENEAPTKERCVVDIPERIRLQTDPNSDATEAPPYAPVPHAIALRSRARNASLSHDPRNVSGVVSVGSTTRDARIAGL